MGEGVAKDAVEAVRWFRKAADQGLPESQRVLGLCYEKGQGITADPIEAYAWLLLASQQSDREAKTELDGLTSRLTPAQIAAAKARAAAHSVTNDPLKTSN